MYVLKTKYYENMRFSEYIIQLATYVTIFTFVIYVGNLTLFFAFGVINFILEKNYISETQIGLLM